MSAILSHINMSTLNTHPHLVARVINEVKLRLLAVQGHAHRLLAIFVICQKNFLVK